MNRQLLDALETCLQAMEKGESLDSALKRYPRLSADLRPLLEAAWAARTLRPSQVPVRAIARSRSRVLTAAAGLRSQKASSSRLKPTWRFVLTSLAVIAFLVLSGNGLLVASARSIPGDVLYPVKRSVETTQLNLSSDPAQKQVLQREFSQRRVEETRSLITIKRVTQVEFDGTVIAQTQDGWLVSGILVTVTSQTRVDGQLQTGREVEVLGETQANGSVQALRLTVSQDEAEPGETATGSPTEGGEQPESSTSVRQIMETPTPDDPEWTRTPGAADGHEPGGDGPSTPGSTESHGEGKGGTQTPEPTESHGSEWKGTGTPQSTGEHHDDH
jgi:hypothetical protein